MAETVRDAFEEWAHADHRRLEPNEYEADDRTPGNNHYYDDDTTNQAYIGWCAAWNRRPTDPAVAELVEANPGFMILQEYITRAETKEPPCPECGQPYVSARARGLAEDAAQRFGDIALEKNTPEGHYARGAIGQAERTAKDISALCDAADLLHGMVGLIDLLLNRDDLTDELRGVLLNNHRVVDARAALAKHAAKP